MRSIVATATRFASERASANARKKRPLETLNERLGLANKTDVSNYWRDGWPAECNKFYAGPAI